MRKLTAVQYPDHRQVIIKTTLKSAVSIGAKSRRYWFHSHGPFAGVKMPRAVQHEMVLEECFMGLFSRQLAPPATGYAAGIAR
ncbi:hypothetical protein KCP70_10390 [Salmonella enterica subsp. enterica]|nr:hypothetical protein KCP70_10390 [Salmonella enterica subsp. enterica]